ncbi:MAG: hypothetical protein K6B14_04755 [Lachnospiraceae bacterium]|nr:hypothetical protein [Lachnospiraceae bacterium]
MMKRQFSAAFIFRAAVWAGIATLILYMGVRHYGTIQPIVYEEHLDDVAVTVDGDDLTLGDLSFYVLYEEQTVETEAEVYNKKNTRDFWNLHANGIFFKYAAKKYVMEMAIHDHLFYKGALAEGITLSEDDKKALRDSYGDFLDDLLLTQKDSGLYDEKKIYDTMEQIVYAEKYRAYLAERDDTTYAGYGYDGLDYKNWLQDHEVKINESIWGRVSVGDNSLTHKSASGINGVSSDDE